MQTITLSSKGQLVIPKQVRELANIAAGDEFQVHYLNGEIRLRPLLPTTGVTVDQVAGCLARSGRKLVSDTQVRTAVKARLKAEDAATLPGAGKPKTLFKPGKSA